MQIDQRIVRIRGPEAVVVAEQHLDQEGLHVAALSHGLVAPRTRGVVEAGVRGIVHQEPVLLPVLENRAGGAGIRLLDVVNIVVETDFIAALRVGVRLGVEIFQLRGALVDQIHGDDLGRDRSPERI